MKKLIVVLILSSNNCFSMDYFYSCPDSLAKPVERAFINWNFVCDNTINFKRVYSDATVLIDYGTLDMFKGGTLGITWLLRPILVYIKPNNPMLYIIMLHEIGHVLGLKHTTDPEAIMNATLNNQFCLNQTDVNNIRSLLGLSPKIFNFKVKVSRRRVQVITDKVSIFVFNDGFSATGKRIIHKLSRGTFNIKCYYNNMVFISKEVTVK